MTVRTENAVGTDKNMALNKSQLAKLLATENLTVVHNSSARTASFDTEKRVLTLPVWMNMTADVYDLLTGHEVGHALYTDSKELTEGLKALHSKLYPNDDFDTSRSARVLHQVVNVVEDPRIEKLTKRRYPGIKAPFNRGYKILWEQGLFGAADQNVSHLSLTDRINLHFKVGTYISVPFSAEERVFVTMVENAETMDDVFAAAEAIVLHVRANPMREKPQQPQQSEEEGSSSDEMDYDDNNSSPGDSAEDMDDMSEDNESGEDGGENDADYDEYDTDDPDFEHDDGENNDNDDDDSPSGEGADADPCDEGDETRSDSDDDEKESDEESEEETNEASDRTHQDDPVNSFSEHGELDGLRSLTESSFSEGTANLADNNTFFMTVTAPKFDHARSVHDFKRVLLENKRYFANNNQYVIDNLIKPVTQFKMSERKNISYMLKEFELRRAARTHARTLQSKTGRLDTNKLHSYKISDDLFRRNTIVPRGQSHGLFFLVDFSGSMSYCINDLMKSLTSLTMFCRLSNIPFEVYTFTDAYFENGRCNQTSEERQERYALRSDPSKQGLIAPTDAIMSHQVFLRNILSSRMNAAEYNEACVLIRAMAMRASGVDQMGGTPLLQALMISSDLLEKFKKNNGLDSVSFVTMTDGMTDGFSGTQSQQFKYSDRPGYITYTDKVSKKSVTAYTKRASYDGANILCGLVIKSIQERHNANTIGYFIADRRNIRTSLQQLGIKHGSDELFNLSAKFKENDFISLKLLGFDEYFVVSPRIFNLNESDMNSFRSSSSTTAPTARKVFSEYKKALGKREIGRTLLKSFVARITARDAA